MYPQICNPVYSTGNDKLEYTFPLGANHLEKAVNTNKLLFMRFILRMRTATNTSIMAYVSTKSAIRRENIVEKCAASVQLEVNLGELLKFDMLDGLIGDKPQTPEEAVRYIYMNVATPLTFLLRVDQTTLTGAGHKGYDIDVVTVFTMYFISNVKKNSVLRMLQAGKGVSQKNDGSVQPDDDLLRICPLHRISGVYGCIARFEVQNGLYDFESTSLLPISADAEICSIASQTWAQGQRTASKIFVDTIEQHASHVREDFEINFNSQKAYIVAQDVPWSAAEFQHDTSISYLRYAQVRRSRLS